ncbi:DUF4194 domain-containing protein [Gordonia otitidis]|uniref:DUF4194 domain-containing protein n=1 Tax=Gordonia otitidis (strain DSM 44809 / CCUG 52243 / JCM 12355 / NBRC 100426 / IFM 10032) TaxID=1108044 RepID=H5TJP2_GORO1|nr:DUF4194 domain-containing protein [Gordonia otitidis]UEA59008.1 DUF4194 domain-containing protein [Gordonia otitidis]GAB33700.1 hypothetical protein GOOTI_077_00210 [Gordonia otitidis NBRC 100426]
MTSTDTTGPHNSTADTTEGGVTGSPAVPADEYAGYDDLPSAATRGRVDEPRAPRFDGDVSAMPDRACWALQNLLTRRHVSGDRNPQLWAWVTEYQELLRSRLSELDLRLRLVDELQVAFVEQAGYESRWGRRILKRETIQTYDAILALHLAKFLRSSREETAIITREEIHELFAGVTNTIDRDLALFDKRIERAIDKMEELDFLRRHRDDPDTFTVSPVITAVMTASVITDLQRQFEQFVGAGDTGDDLAATTDQTDSDAWDGTDGPSSADDTDAYADEEGDEW